MTDPNFVILYVGDTPRSAAFYERLLGKPPIESAPGFAMFGLANGMLLGLWGRDGVTPGAGHPGGSELVFTADSRATVQQRHADWSERGLQILQAPVDLDFGHTFVAADPDGHRLRVFHPSAA